MTHNDNHFAFLSDGVELAVSFSNDLRSLKKGAGGDAVIELVSSRLVQLDIFDSFAFYLLYDQLDFELAKCVPASALDGIEEDMQAHIENGTFSWALDNGRPLSITGPVSQNGQVLFPLSTRRRTHGMFIGNARGGEEVAGYMLSIIRMILTIAIDNIDGMSLTQQLVENNQQLEQRVNERTIELKQAIILAEDANRSKSVFLANMSHDIRTPMNGVLGMLDILRTTPLELVQYEYVETAYRSGEHLLSLLNDILDLSKVESGSMDIDYIDFNLIKLIDDLIALFSVKVKENNNQIYSLIDEDVPEVIVSDKTRLWQVLVNLLGNAIKFTEHGDIILRVSRTSHDEQNVDLRFEVEDTGVGIRPDALDRVFNPFQQAEVSTTREYGGTGLGLTLCKRLLELLGGEIGVDSEFGKGTCFWFSLSAKSSQKPDSLKINYNNENRVVLLLGENVSLNEVFSKHLSRLGVLFEYAHDAREAKEIINTHAGKDNEITTLLASSASILEQLDIDNHDISIWCPDVNNTLSSSVHALKLPVTFSVVLDILYGGSTQESIDDQGLSQFNGRVLVVDDNKVNRMVMRGILNHLGVDIVFAESGQQALDILAKQAFDIVLMDIQMPGMNGYEATRRLRQSGSENQDVIVVAVTANVMQKDIDMGMDVGMNDYLGKPVSLQKISELFTRYLQVRSTKKLKPAELVVAKQGESVDEHAVGQLKLLMKDGFYGVVDVFIDRSTTHIEKIAEVMGHDKDESVLHAHSVKGSAANIGARKLSSIAEQLEAALKNEDIDNASSLLVAARDELKIAATLLRA